jgi:myo-inositol 2-dehydrogenase/D-chiro-inositol 1-dehydrogenase
MSTEKTLGFALLGAGRMAHVYGPKIAAHPGLRLVRVYNHRIEGARATAQAYGGTPSDDLAETLADPGVDAVVVATPTSTHLEYITSAAEAGKPIYCEKPLDLTMDRTIACLDVLHANPVPFMLGFNRRFDPDNAALRAAVQAGDIGKLTFLMSWSREPSPPPIAYVKSSGGYFVDATIHDIDLLCWIAGERPEQVFATGSCLFDPEIGAAGDADATMTTLKFPSGAMAQVNNSRQCAYGFDQRLEAFGTIGMVQTRNHRTDALMRWDASATEAQAPLKHFFLERYDASFNHALDAFRAALQSGNAPSPTAQDGRMALSIALACTQAMQTGAAIKPDYGDIA